MQIQENISLAPYTTLRIGGPARYLAWITAEDELVEAVSLARAKGWTIFVLGGGSNLVVPDEGFPGLVLQIAFPPAIVREDGAAALFFDVSAGTDWDGLVLELCQQGISGMECLAGIPGLVGGSPIQNIGAYGQEVSQVIESVRVLDLETLEFVTFSSADCRFSYRSSFFNQEGRGRYVVTRVRFRLDPAATPNLSYGDLARLRGTHPTPLNVFHAVRAIRDRKGMLIDPAHPSADARSAGSFFKNPIVSVDTLPLIGEALGIAEGEIPNWPAGAGWVKLPAAWLIERAGFPKGFALSPESPVAISTRHTLALTNRSGCARCADLLALRDHLMSTVRAKFGIALEQEPVMLS